jgi:serine phosphatase RsbU (regulator of sigma subunit)
VVLLVVVPLALVSFVTHFGQESVPTLVQGPLVVDPGLGDRLASVLPAGFIRASQLTIHVAGFLFFVGLAILIALRTTEPLPLAASAMLVAAGASLFAPLGGLEGGLARVARLVGEVVPGQTASFWVSLSGILLVAFVLAATTSRFGRGDIAVLAVLIAAALITALSPGWLLDPSRLQSPWRQLWTAGVPIAVLAAGWWRTLRQPVEHRRQVRPVLVALALVLAAYLVLALLRPDLGSDAFGLVLATPRLQALYGINTLLLLTGAVFTLPISIVLAVVRYRLFEIDLLVNRALVYGSLTGIVTLVFLAVTLLAAGTAGGFLGEEVTGQQVGQAAAIAGVVTGTVMAGGLQPLRRRLQGAVDRRFYREKFDAERSLEQLAARLGDVVDGDVLRLEVLHLLDTTLQPEWDDLYPAGQIPAGILQRLPDRDPILDPLPGVAAAVPIRSNERMVGALALGPRKSGMPYRGLELQFLARVAERVGPALRMVELVGLREADRLHRERYEQELNVARRIQRELLPRQVPQPEGWCFEVFYEPAREVGGDFYDFYELGPGLVGLAVGDVTDKGMPAALVMASCRTVLRGIALGSPDLPPGEVLRRANELLVGDIPAGMFITCLYGILQPQTGNFLFANAGHNPPVHRVAGVAEQVRARGMPLGLLTGMEYEEAVTSLAPGDVLVFTSDGITETHDPDGRMFGFKGLFDALSTHGADVIPTLIRAQQAFAGPGRDQEDDVTVIAVTRTETEP